MNYSSPKSTITVMLLVQLIIAGGAFYFCYKFNGVVQSRSVANARLATEIKNVKCDSVNKDTVVGIVNALTIDANDMASMCFWFGALGLIMAGFSVASLRALGKSHIDNQV